MEWQVTAARTSPRGGGAARRLGEESGTDWPLLSIAMGGKAAQYPLVIVAHRRGGGTLPESPHSAPIMIQQSDAESKAAKSPQRETATYLRE
jgi:hypothetical protein